jgi:hypothetical protein
MVPPPPIMGPTPAQIPVLPRVGFDILAENIHAVHRYVQPSHKTTGGAVLAVGRTIRSAFTLGAGKRSVSRGERGDDGRGDDGTKPAKRCILPCITPSVGESTSVVTRSSLPSWAPEASGTSEAREASESNADKYFSYSPTDGLVPGHPSPIPSVLQPVYRRLAPEDVVRVTAGDV